MINLEKMNDVVNSLEQVATNLNKISEITNLLGSSVSSSQEILNTISDYDKRTFELKNQIDALVSNLNSLETNYKLEKESYDKTQEKLTEFKNSVDNLKNDTETAINNLNTNVVKKIDEYIVLLNSYDQKREELNSHIVSLVNKLEDIRNDYHKVSSSFELVETDLKQFNSKIDLQAIESEKQKKELENHIVELQNNFNEKCDKILKDNKTLKICLAVSIVLIVTFGIINILM